MRKWFDDLVLSAQYDGRQFLKMSWKKKLAIAMLTLGFVAWVGEAWDRFWQYPRAKTTWVSANAVG
jgi:hypothetical protein